MVAASRFGESVDLDGNRLIAGAPATSDPTDHAGTAYVFDETAGVWTETGRLEPSDSPPDGRFGLDVGISDQRVIVGAPGHSTCKGAAYFFSFDGSTWTEDDFIVVETSPTCSYYGDAVDIDGTLALVGSNGGYLASVSQGGGLVEVIEEQGAGVWVRIAQLAPVAGQLGGQFGDSVHLDGTTAWIGQPKLAAFGGTTPGFTYAGIQVPLNPDAYFDASLLGANLLPFSNTLGVLGADGTGRAALRFESAPSLIGLQLDHAFGALDLVTGALTFLSNPAHLALGP